MMMYPSDLDFEKWDSHGDRSFIGLGANDRSVVDDRLTDVTPESGSIINHELTFIERSISLPLSPLSQH